MSRAAYTNLDNTINKTSFWPNVVLDQLLYQGELGGIEPLIDATKITIEIPVVDRVTAFQNDDYWQAEPKYKTKLAEHKIFKTKYAIYPESFAIYMDGTKIPADKYTLTSIYTFELDGTLPDGYLWVSYYTTRSGYNFGNKSYDSAKVVTDHKVPMFSTDLIIRCRKLINNIEAYYSISPTTWLGGFDNDSIGILDNLIKGITSICTDHITELQVATKRLAIYMSGIISQKTFPSTFTTVTETSFLNVKHLNEIISSLYKIEVETANYASVGN